MKTSVGVCVGVLCAGFFIVTLPREARADDASVSVGQRFAEPPDEQPPPRAAGPIAVDDDGRFRDPPRELRRSAFRLQLGPTAVTTGKGFGMGVGLGAEFGSGSVGGRLSAAWMRGEGRTGDGAITATGDSVGHYSGELTLDLHKRGPLHPVLGLGIGLVHVSRPDTSGFAGVGTGRFVLEYALGLDDADVRVGGGVTGGMVGPVDTDVKDLRAYALAGLHVAIGF